MVDTYWERLLPELEARGWKVQQLADAMKISYQAVRKVKEGGSFSSQNNIKAAKLLKLNPVWLATGVGQREVDGADEDDDTSGKVPLISSVQAGAWSEIVDNFQPGDASEWIPCPAKHGPHTFALTVEGESMSNPGAHPSYEPGSIIFVDPGRSAQPGDRVVVRLEAQEQATFKQYLEEDGRKFLRAINPDWRPKFIEIDGDATICGVVIGKWVPE
jgi:SOS-response transcriptional repressor LexA